MPTSSFRPGRPVSWNAPSENSVAPFVGTKFCTSWRTEPSGMRIVTRGANPWLIR